MQLPIAKIITLAITAGLLSACATQDQNMPAAAASAQASKVHDTKLVTVALIMGEPNYATDGAYQELVEGLYSKPELKPGNKMFAPVKDIVTNMGGEYSLDAAKKTATYRWMGKVITVTAGSTAAQVNGVTVQFDLASELRADGMWVSLPSFFEQMDAWTKWEPARQRFSATMIMPATKKTEGLAKGGKVTEATLNEQPIEFYGSADGRILADVILAYQNKDGGWPKVDPTTNMLTPVNPAYFTGIKAKSTIDNDSTMKQIRVLARAYTALKDPRYLAGFNRGMDYIFAAQLDNGGWQQFWPEPQGYKKRITFNDDAIANVLEVMRDINSGAAEFKFIDAGRAAKSKQAFDKGLAMILKAQLTVVGRKAGWCAQVDEVTLAPATGRAFELPSVSGHETVNIVKFLMSLDKPSPTVIQAVQDAVAWLDAVKLPGVTREKQIDYTLENGFDYILVKNPNSQPSWARFYDLDTGKPLFTSRDGIKRKDFTEVAYERRTKYNWFTEYPRELLSKDYPAWQAKWAPKQNVLAH